MDLIRDLYVTHQDNRTFLHTRYGLAGNSLELYKNVISLWMWPDPFRHDNPSVAKAKQAIAVYKHAVGGPKGLAELMIFFCEQGTGFCADLGYEEESFMNSLCRMFEQAIQAVGELSQAERDPFLTRLHRVRDTAHRFGYGVGDAMDGILLEYEDQPNTKARRQRR